MRPQHENGEITMPTFDTPGPISATIDIGVGDVRITAIDRGDTTVEVRPSDGSKDSDVKAAEQTRVEYAAGRLLVKAPKTWRRFTWSDDGGSVDVTVDLPTGSHLQVDASMAAFHCGGSLGECRVKTGGGDIQLDHAGTTDLRTGVGAIVVDKVAGNAEVSTGTGRVRLGEIGGTALIKSSTGDISVDRASADVTAKTAYGDVRVGEVARGSASLRTPYGEIEIGIHAGTAARLDVSTGFGRVHNAMETAEEPEPSDETVEVRAHTGFGDIVIRRSESLREEQV